MRAITILALIGTGCVPAEYADEPQAPEAETQSDVQHDEPTDEDPAAPADNNDSVESFEDRLPDLKGELKEIIVAPDVLMMGLDTSDEDYSDEHLPHMVELTHTWTIMETEVTHLQWEAHMDYPIRGLYDAPTVSDCDECPVHSVSWHEAQAFANALSASAGLEQCFECEGEGPEVFCEPSVDPYECNGFRLPTEAEWEYAAKGGESFTYPGSDNIEDIAFWVDNSGDRAYPVGSKLPNGFGLYDMGGNIRERVYDAYYPYSGADEINPVVYPDFDLDAELFSERGGSYACRRPEIRWNRRNLVWDYDRDVHTGFRVARILE